MSEYHFTKDWFHWAPKVWTQLAPALSGTAGHRHFLEIGSFEGRSSVWIAENMMQDGDELRCIDTWKGGEERGDVEERFRHNLAIAAERFPRRHIFQSKGRSIQELARCLVEAPEGFATFDFIYIDGSHEAPDVLTDACMSWPLLNAGGLMVFDDYMWGNPRDPLHRPKIAIDAFTTIFGETAEVIRIGYQLVVRKNR